MPGGRSLVLVGLLLPAAALPWACSEPEAAAPGDECADCSAPCTADADCVEGQGCVAGVCVERDCADCSVPCATDGDCVDGLACVAGVCTPRDCADRSCPGELFCADGRCESPSCLDVVCDAGQICAAGSCWPTECGGLDCGEDACVDGVCVAPTCVGVTCPAGQACAIGQCYPAECSAEDCVPDEVCADGRCQERHCVGVVCPDEQLCARGSCFPGDCPGAECGPAEACVDGSCGLAACAGMGCPDGELCATGECFPTACENLTCGTREVCLDGEGCVPDACPGRSCPEGSLCAAGGTCASGSCPGLPPCAEGEVCAEDGARCVGPSCYGVDCAAGEACARGACFATSCGATACDPGSVCVDGACLEGSCVGVACAAGERCSGGDCEAGCDAACAAGCSCVGGVPHETGCDDGADNDGDGAADCADADCEGLRCDDGDLCTDADACAAGSCSAAARQCPDEGCGGSCDPATGTCTAGLETAGTVCRQSRGGCDPAELCDGTSPGCPGDATHGAGFECRPAASPCDPAELCSGAADACPQDVPATIGTDCGQPCGANGECAGSCIGGACRPRSGAGGGCDPGDDGDCVAGELCTDGSCLGSDGAPCGANDECVRTCLGGACAAESGTGGACDANDGADCLPGHGCVGVSCLLVDGSPCGADAACASGQCECADAACVGRACSAVDCPCGFNADGSAPCDGPVGDGVDDADDSCGPTTCDGGSGCNLPDGAGCVTDAACESSQCECADPLCSRRVCSAGDCDCSFDAAGDGSCDGPLDCDDQAPCTADACQPGVGCVHLPDDLAACSDGDACTVGDRCLAGSCLPGGAPACDDGNPCTDELCDPVRGCLSVDNDANGCDDGSVCTIADRCFAGSCTGSPISCLDDNLCTDDSCDPLTGCIFAANDANACNDGDRCTGGDHCASAACVGAAVSCDDLDLYTTDSCAPATGCEHTPLVPVLTSLVPVSPTPFGTIGGTPVPASLLPVVRALDQLGNPLAGVTITWSVSGGSAGGTSGVTGADGTLQLGSWTPATAYTSGDAGWTQTVTASSGAVGATFTANVHGVWGFFHVSGNSQLVAAGGVTPLPIVLGVTDSVGNPVAGATIWCYSPNHVVFTGPTTLVSDAAGQVAVTGVQLDASGLSGSFVCSPAVSRWGSSLTAQVTVAQPWGFTYVSGNGQVVPPGGSPPAPAVFRLTGQTGDPIAGATVSCAPESGVSLATATFVSDLDGYVYVDGVTLDLSGSNGLYRCETSTRFGLATNSITVTARWASAIVVSSGNGQFVSVGQSPADPLVLLVTDPGGAPVPGAAVSCQDGPNFTVPPGPFFTDAAGLVTIPGAVATGYVGGTSFNCSTPTSWGSASTAFSFTVAQPAILTSIAGNDQRLIPGGFVSPITLQLLDQRGNPISGVAIDLRNLTGAGGPSYTGPAQLTSAADGTAVIPGGSWQVGSTYVWDATPGQSLEASVGGCCATTVSAHLSYAASFVLNGGGWRELSPGSTMVAAVTVYDQWGASLPNAPLQWDSVNGGISSSSPWTSGGGTAAASILVGPNDGPSPLAYQLSFFALGGRTGGTVASGWICGVPSRPACP